MQAARDEACLAKVRVRHDQQVAVVVGRPEQVRATSLLAHDPRDGLLDRDPQRRAVQIGELGQAIYLQQHNPHGDPMAASARELILHQVQDLRLRE